MKLTDSMTVLKNIEKMPLAEKQKKVQEIQAAGFKYESKEIKEIIKEKWAFVESGSESDMVDIDDIIFEWAKAEELRLEKEQAKSGKTVIDKYFKKYGTLSHKEKPKDLNLHSQILYFDGKACPGSTWNSELFMYRLYAYKSYDRNDSEPIRYVQLSADMYVEDLMDAKMKGDEPYLRHCHDWHTEPHKKSVNHYKHEDWLEDLKTARNLFIKEMEKMIGEHEIFQYNSKTRRYCIPEKFMFWFEEEQDHNGDDTTFYRSEIYNGKNYKEGRFRPRTCKVPTKFDQTISRGELLEIAIKHCEDKFTKHNMRREFKY